MEMENKYVSSLKIGLCKQQLLNETRWEATSNVNNRLIAQIAIYKNTHAFQTQNQKHIIKAQKITNFYRKITRTFINGSYAFDVHTRCP